MVWIGAQQEVAVKSKESKNFFSKGKESAAYSPAFLHFERLVVYLPCRLHRRSIASIYWKTTYTRRGRTYTVRAIITDLMLEYVATDHIYHHVITDFMEYVHACWVPGDKSSVIALLKLNQAHLLG